MNVRRIFQRSLSIMASSTISMSPFSKGVVAAMRKLYPEALADSSFDNTGLLLESPHRSHLENKALLTIDLTKGVAEEAIEGKYSIIVAYHPVIFRPLKALTLANTQQSTLLRLAQEGISVYSPHTAVDAAVGGLNDWLADLVAGVVSSRQSITSTRSVITAVKSPPNGHDGAGYGRILRFSEPVKLSSIVAHISGQLEQKLSVAIPQSFKGQNDQVMVSSVGICAGSGGSLLNGVDVDLLFTGELSHHETLAAIEQGRSVITTFHSNSERGYLSAMASKLNEAMEEATVSGEEEPVDWKTVGIVQTSSVDRDPYTTVG